MLYNSDSAAKRVQETNSNLKRVLIEKFGSKYYIGENINTDFVRSLIFGGSEKNYENLYWITETVGVFVKIDFVEFCKQNQDASYILAESAILFETGFNNLCHLTINVKSADPISAACKRDSIDKEDWLIRMKTQIPENEKYFDFTIINDYTPNVIEQIKKIHDGITRTR